MFKKTVIVWLIDFRDFRDLWRICGEFVYPRLNGAGGLEAEPNFEVATLKLAVNFCDL